MNATDERARFCFGVVILAAGASTRMGTCKMLLPWGAASVIGCMVRQWSQLGAEQIGIVCAPAHVPLQEELDRLHFPPSNRILNPAPARGMFSSIQCAAQWTGWEARLTHWIITLGDQPHLRPATLRILLDHGADHPDKITQPIRLGHARHPVLLPRHAFHALADAPDKTLKEFLRNGPVDLNYCAIDDPGLDLDIDLPADYEKAVQFYQNPA